MNGRNVGRPSSGREGKLISFMLWEENRCELDNLKKGTRTEEINLALQRHFRYKGKIDQDILFQIEEHQKTIERHQGIINNLEEELGKQQKEKKQEEGSKKDAITGIYKGLCDKIISSNDKSFWGSTKESTDVINEQFRTNYTSKQLKGVVKKIVDGCSIVEDDFLPFYQGGDK